MILADVSLDRRIDGFESRGSKAIGEAAKRRNPDARPFVRPLGQGIAVYSGPDSPANKIIGVGFHEEVEDEVLEEIEQAYFERGSVVQAEIATLVSHTVHTLFTSRGYLLQGFENVLGSNLAELNMLPAENEGMEIEIVQPREIDTWIEVVITGFEHPDDTGSGSGVSLPTRQAIKDAFAAFLEVPGFRAYLTRVGGAPAGGGGLRIDEGIAQLCGASTLPDFRRRGIQGALLRRRLQDARRAGCDLGIMTSQPGSRSHFNAQRQGFVLLYSRAVLVKAPPIQVAAEV
ncbi:MAG TPA: GNAT family N-acetyltransferase [Acidobacteriota bacterium]|nr:GNAT family N-acetyltransferase [Acidobacteriota bacterium]